MEEYHDADDNNAGQEDEIQAFDWDNQLIPSKNRSFCSTAKSSFFGWILAFAGMFAIFCVMIVLFVQTLSEVQKINDSHDEQILNFNQTIQNLIRENAKLREKIHRQMNNYTNLSTKAGKLQANFEEIESKATQLENENGRMQKEIHIQWVEANGMNNKSAKISKWIGKLKTNTAVLNASTANLQKRLQTQLTQTGQLDNLAQNLEKKMKSIEKITENFHNEIIEIREDQAGLKIHLAQQINTTTKLSNQASDLKTNITKIYDEIPNIENISSSLHAEYSKLSATALRHVNKTAQLEIEITQLVNETNKLKNRSKNPAGCPTLPKQPDPGWTQYGGYQYKFMYFSYSWTSARQSCHRYGADLMVHGIQDYSRRRDLIKLLTLPLYTSIWIGLNDLDREGSWCWVGSYPSNSGTPATRSAVPWSRNEPKSRISYSRRLCDCASISFGSSLLYASSWPCSYTKKYVCEKPL